MRRWIKLAVIAGAGWWCWSNWDSLNARLTQVPDQVRAQVLTGGQSCDAAYPAVCIAPPPPYLSCGEVKVKNFKVVSPDPHGFDPDRNGLGCEPPPRRRAPEQ